MAILENKEKLDLVNGLKSNKIEFLIQNPDSFKLNTKIIDKNVFILFTSESLKKENVNWNEIFQFYLDFSKEYIDKENSKFFYCDIEINTNWNKIINNICIYQYKNAKIINNNLFDSNKEIFKLNRARCSNMNYNLKPATKMNSLFVS